jgi:hypothetical protein
MSSRSPLSPWFSTPWCFGFPLPKHKQVAGASDAGRDVTQISDKAPSAFSNYRFTDTAHLRYCIWLADIFMLLFVGRLLILITLNQGS